MIAEHIVLRASSAGRGFSELRSPHGRSRSNKDREQRGLTKRQEKPFQPRSESLLEIKSQEERFPTQ